VLKFFSTALSKENQNTRLLQGVAAIAFVLVILVIYPKEHQPTLIPLLEGEPSGDTVSIARTLIEKKFPLTTIRQVEES